MKTIIINKSILEEDLPFAVACILSNNCEPSVDFNAETTGTIIEYDLTEKVDPIYWKISEVSYNEDGSVKSVDIDC